MILFKLGYFGWLVVIAVTIYLNYFRIEKRHVKPTYFNSNWSRGVFGFACLVAMTVHLGFDPWYLHTWIPAIPAILYIFCSWGFLFDPGLNIARGKDIDYQGKTSGILDKLGKPYYITLKIICLILFILSSINLWQTS